MVKNIIGLLMAIAILSCNSRKNKSNIPYRIIEKDVSGNLKKIKIKVELNNKISENKLQELSKIIFEETEECEQLYIGYFLPNSTNIWAVGNFTPKMEIDIVGATIQQDSLSNILISEIKDNIIGKWKADNFLYVFYRKNNSVFLRCVYKGQPIDEEMTESKHKGLVKFENKEKGSNGEYFIINKLGELESYNKENKKFDTAKVLN